MLAGPSGRIGQRRSATRAPGGPSCGRGGAYILARLFLSHAGDGAALNSKRSVAAKRHSVKLGNDAGTWLIFGKAASDHIIEKSCEMIMNQDDPIRVNEGGVSPLFIPLIHSSCGLKNRSPEKQRKIFTYFLCAGSCARFTAMFLKCVALKGCPWYLFMEIFVAPRKA
jgi:hypothetical protein